MITALFLCLSPVAVDGDTLRCQPFDDATDWEPLDRPTEPKDDR